MLAPYYIHGKPGDATHTIGGYAEIMEPKTVLVCGGRAFANMQLVFTTLDEIRSEFDTKLTIVTGGAPGADRSAYWWAIARGENYRSYRTDWKRHGKAAGPIRNQHMLDDAQPVLVVAFPGGRGTQDMVNKARAAGVEVREIHETGSV